MYGRYVVLQGARLPEGLLAFVAHKRPFVGVRAGMFAKIVRALKTLGAAAAFETAPHYTKPYEMC